MNDNVLVDVVDGVATMTLNRPDKLNALNAPMLDALAAAYARCDTDDDVRVVVRRIGACLKRFQPLGTTMWPSMNVNAWMCGRRSG
jgi:1,4-dihydroxy-2-naphthoyl-CoA synthase